MTHPNSIPPMRSFDGDAGYDLAACEDVVIRPGEVADVPTGIHVEMPDGVWAMITGRSSTIRKRGLLVTTGIIDNGYRGELFYAVLNPSNQAHPVKRGDRLAQLIFFPLIEFERWHLTFRTDLTSTPRGVEGFGSTGD